MAQMHDISIYVSVILSKMWIDVGCWRKGMAVFQVDPSAKAGAQAALLGKLRRLDPAISTEEQYMVDVSWRQDVPSYSRGRQRRLGLVLVREVFEVFRWQRCKLRPAEL